MSDDYKPFIPANQIIPEFTFVPLMLGVILGIIFGASSLYLALKVGATVSASIPCAVLAITLFRGFSKLFGVRKATILENNIVQTTGSAGESVAFGVAVTMPALLILGFNMDVQRTLIVAVLGGALGVLMMIPMRWSLIVKEHGKLAYPEGTACAEILIAGEKGGTSAKMVFGGFFIGLLYKFLNVGAKLWKEIPAKAFASFKGSSIAADISPELLGVGYIIGPRVCCYMMAGGVLANFVVIPMIYLFGSQLLAPLYPATKIIAQMEIREIWRSYVLYIGAGAVATGGIISLFRSLPSIIHGATAGLKGLKGTKLEVSQQLRTEKSLPMWFVFAGCVVLVLAMSFTPTLNINLLGAVLMVVFGFLFVTVSSRLTGEVGSSANPISGMTVATLIVVSLIFLALGWVSLPYRLTAMSIAAVVCVAASNAGTTSQDLKTGYLVGATPKYQQWGVLIGSITSALVIGYSLNILNDAATIYSKNNFPQDVIVQNVGELQEMEQAKGQYGDDKNLYHVLHLPETPKTGPLSTLLPGKYLINDGGQIQYFVDPGINGTLLKKDDGTTVTKYEAPKARLMALIIDGILSRKLPWGLVLLGAFMTVMIELMGIPSLPVAVGIYLPISSSMPIFAGGMVRYIVDLINRRRGAALNAADAESGPGTLFSSGLIAGGAIAGIVLSFMAINSKLIQSINLGHLLPHSFTESSVVATCFFSLLALVLVKVGLVKKK